MVSSDESHMLNLDKWQQHKNTIIFSLQFQVCGLLHKILCFVFLFIAEALVMIFIIPNESNWMELGLG